MTDRATKRSQGIGAAYLISGGNQVNPAQWDDLKFPANAENLLNPAGRIDFDTSELTVDFQTNATLSDSFFGVGQIPHECQLESSIRPHIHFFQIESNVPNWLLELRIYKNGSIVPATFERFAIDQLVFTYSSGVLAQIACTDLVDMTSSGPFGVIDSVSSIVDFKIYRDTANASGLFSGADPQSLDAKLKEFDIHYQIDSAGSNSEFTKGGPYG